VQLYRVPAEGRYGEEWSSIEYQQKADPAQWSSIEYQQKGDTAKSGDL
jgi:hypothetical protein